MYLALINYISNKLAKALGFQKNLTDMFQLKRAKLFQKQNKNIEIPYTHLLHILKYTNYYLNKNIILEPYKRFIQYVTHSYNITLFFKE